MQSKIENIIYKFNFQGSSGSLIQYWKAHSKYLTIKDQPFQSTQDDDDEGVLSYREECLQNNCYYLNERQPNYGLYSFAGQAARSGVVKEQNSYTDKDVIMGQLAVPVYDDTVLVGVIELITDIPQQSYAKEFNRICRLLKKENLATRM